MMTWIALVLGCASAPELPPVQPADVPETAQAEAGAGCTKTTCSLGDNAHLDLDDTAFISLLDTWSSEPLGISTLALDSLLFDAEHSLALLETHGDRLSPERRQWLERELKRMDVVVEMRLVDETGAVRADLASTAFPLREKQHLPFRNTGSLGWLETGGKIKRVGLGHLWSRW